MSERRIIHYKPHVYATETPRLECKWVYEHVGWYYTTECGQTWSFESGGIKDNNVKFCPFCGGRIKL